MKTVLQWLKRPFCRHDKWRELSLKRDYSNKISNKIIVTHIGFFLGFECTDCGKRHFSLR